MIVCQTICFIPIWLDIWNPPMKWSVTKNLSNILHTQQSVRHSCIKLSNAFKWTSSLAHLIHCKYGHTDFIHFPLNFSWTLSYIKFGNLKEFLSSLVISALELFDTIFRTIIQLICWFWSPQPCLQPVSLQLYLGYN